MRILGIETSCDETAVAILDDGNKLQANLLSSQAHLHERFGGVVPEIASRAHLENINPLIELALRESGTSIGSIDGVAVTMGPGLVGALLVGIAAAKGVALGLGVPLIGVNHLEGHIYANFLERGPLEEPYVSFLVSGGHTMLVFVPEPHVYEVLGQTLDDAAGEAFDKIARLLGLGFPGGPALDRLAAKEPQPQEPSDLVEGLTSGVVQRLAQDLVHVGLGYEHEHGVAPGDQERDVRFLQWPSLEEVGVDVALEVVHTDQRDSQPQRHALGGGDPDEQGADQPWAHRDCHPVDGADRRPRFPQGQLDQGIDVLQVSPRGDLRHHAAEPLVQMSLAGQQIGLKLVAIVQDGHGRLVTRGLDPQDAHRSGSPVPRYEGRMPSGTCSMIRSSCPRYSGDRTASTHITTASSPVS